MAFDIQGLVYTYISEVTMDFLEFIKIVIFGIIEGITEWLPISSTGHLLLAEQFIKLNVSQAFWDVFLVVIQLGAIMAVVLVFWNKIWPFTTDKETHYVKIPKIVLWLKIFVACIPAAIIGLLFEDAIDSVFYTEKTAPYTVGTTLVLYGILFIVIENYNKKREPQINSLATLTFKTAFFIGIFQLLALIPGTSRSGATIIGAILLGTSRPVAAEFTFYLAIPVMAGASLLKVVKFISDNGMFSGNEIVVLMIGCIAAFLVSFFVIKFLMDYIRKHDFKPFGWYRIAAGIVVLVYFSAFA